MHNELTFQPKEPGNDELFQFQSAANHNYDVWQKSLDLGLPCSTSRSSSSRSAKHKHKHRKKRKKFGKYCKTRSQSKVPSLSDDDDDELDFGDLDESDESDVDNAEEEEDDDVDDDLSFNEVDNESDAHRIAMNDAFTDNSQHSHTEHKEDEKVCALELSALERKMHRALRPVLPHLRYALMNETFFIDNCARWLSAAQRDAVYVHFLLRERPTRLFNDGARIEYSNERFWVAASNVRVDKARALCGLDDWWSHTNFASQSPQWFVVRLPDPSYVVRVDWKNRWGDGETAKDVELQVSTQRSSFSESDSGWTLFWSFRSEKTSNWLRFEVPQNEEIKPSLYWRFVVKTLYGDNSCRCGLDQIKIICSL